MGAWNRGESPQVSRIPDITGRNNTGPCAWRNQLLSALGTGRRGSGQKSGRTIPLQWLRSAVFTGAYAIWWYSYPYFGPICKIEEVEETTVF